MSRKRHDDLGRAGGSSSTAGTTMRGGSGGKAVWDTGSSLYDSYELAAVRRLLDRRLLAGAGVLPLATDGAPPAVAAAESDDDKQLAVVGRARRKVTLRVLFRAVATWASRPRHAPPLACACAGMVRVHGQKGGAVQPDVPSHGEI